MTDSAFIARVSTVSLAGLGLASAVLTTVIGLSVFLAYSTTASVARAFGAGRRQERSEEHTSELQSRGHLVCRLLLEKKKRGRVTKINKITVIKRTEKEGRAERDMCHVINRTAYG